MRMRTSRALVAVALVISLLAGCGATVSETFAEVGGEIDDDHGAHGTGAMVHPS